MPPTIRTNCPRRLVAYLDGDLDLANLAHPVRDENLIRHLSAILSAMQSSQNHPSSSLHSSESCHHPQPSQRNAMLSTSTACATVASLTQSGSVSHVPIRRSMSCRCSAVSRC